MLGVGHVKIDRPAVAKIAQIVQGPFADRHTSAGLTAAGTGRPLDISTAFFDFRGRQILDPRDALRDIRHIFAWAIHDDSPGRSASAENIGQPAWAAAVNSTSLLQSHLTT